MVSAFERGLVAKLQAGLRLRSRPTFLTRHGRSLKAGPGEEKELPSGLFGLEVAQQITGRNRLERGLPAGVIGVEVRMQSSG